MPQDPLAYFLTFTTYGTWLQGRDPGWVDRTHNEFGTPIPAADPLREGEQRAKLRQPEYRLNKPRRPVVLQTILEVAAHRQWRIWAVHVRTKKGTRRTNDLLRISGRPLRAGSVSDDPQSERRWVLSPPKTVAHASGSEFRPNFRFCSCLSSASSTECDWVRSWSRLARSASLP